MFRNIIGRTVPRTVACFAFLAVGCSGIALSNVETAIADLEEANTHLEAAVEAVADDPTVGQATLDVLEAYGDLQNALRALEGRERLDHRSCFQRCGVSDCLCENVCIANCIRGGVHPVCPTQCQTSGRTD